ncbi:MAG: hypothetical protein WCW65_02685 [Candidatus Paceibacterota bacterium]
MSKKNLERIHAKIDKITVKNKEKKARQTKIEVWVAIGLMALGSLSAINIFGMFGLYSHLDFIKREKELKAKYAMELERKKGEKITEEKRITDLGGKTAKNISVLYLYDKKDNSLLFRINLIELTVYNKDLDNVKLKSFTPYYNGFDFEFDWMFIPYRHCAVKEYDVNKNRTYFTTDVGEIVYIKGDWRKL